MPCMKGGVLMVGMNKGRRLAIYSAGHFLVDFACAFLMFSLPMSGSDRLLGIILYNFCAFALQMPVGLIADRLNRNGAVAALGLCLTLVSFLSVGIPLLCVVILGLGNCLYHIGGGVDVLYFSDRKQWMLGVFVSPGAVGLFLGAFIANNKLLSILSFGLMLLVLSVVIIWALNASYSLKKPSENACDSIKPRGRAPLLAVMCLFTVVVLRSYVGLTLYTPWKTGYVLPALAVMALAFGKAVGGFLADLLGEMRTATVSLALCSVLFIFSENALCGILAIFLFNMTMPLTLFATARMFRGARGFAFGCLTFALFLGCVPEFLSLPIPFYGEVWFHALEAAFSLVLLALGLFACREKGAFNE